MNEEGIGVIDEKIEKVKESDNSQYWKFKIILDKAEKPLTFSLWDYKAGTLVKTGEQVKILWNEKEGVGFEGKPVTYRNIQSIGTLEKYERDPNLGSDTELVENAPKNSLEKKDIVHKETKSPVGEDSSSAYAQREERKQRLIVRQSSLNYATQLATAECIWDIKNTDRLTIDEMKDKIKEIAKEYEKQIMREEK